MATSWTPWHKVVEIKEEVLSGEMALNQFAADLYEVVMQKDDSKSIYKSPDSFFSITFPALNLRKLAGEVIQRLSGDKNNAVYQLALTYGGGKTHTLITLAHLVRNPKSLPNIPAVNEFKAAAGCEIPKARVVALCFDKIDVLNGLEVPSPSEGVRRFKYPWSILAWQIAGSKGIAVLNLHHPEEERDVPPSEDPINKLLSPELRRGPLLILVDELLMYAHTIVARHPEWHDYLVHFFQALTQAVSKTNDCCLVASLLSSNIEDSDIMGLSLQSAFANIFGRQQEKITVAVTKDEVPEILRRRFFTPASLSSPERFREHIQTALNNIATLDSDTRKHMAEKEKEYEKSYPFHPDFINVFFSKWNNLPTFQRTRGLLRTFALALRDAAKWDSSPLIGTALFLPESQKKGSLNLPDGLQELVSVVDRSVKEGTPTAWGSILITELEHAIEAESMYGLTHREIEQAVITVFLHSQPIGMDVSTKSLWSIISMTAPQEINLKQGLQHWAEASFWLDDELVAAVDDTKLPKKWKLGTKPNLKQMQAAQKSLLTEASKQEKILTEVNKKNFSEPSDFKVIWNPKSSADIPDDGTFVCVVLGPEEKCKNSPSSLALRYLQEGKSAQNPRIHKNAIVLLAPSLEGWDLCMDRSADLIAWEKVRESLKYKQEGDYRRIEEHIKSSSKKLREVVQQTWCMAITFDEQGEARVYKLTLATKSPFEVIREDSRIRLQSSAINPDTMMPDGPYALWAEGDQFRKVSDLLGSFSKRTSLPKIISFDPLVSTIKVGCLQGKFVVRSPRPDGSVRTWWMETPDEEAMKNRDKTLEAWLPEYATLGGIAPDLLSQGNLPELWEAEKNYLSVTKILEYFSGQSVVTIQREGYEEQIPVPRMEKESVFKAIKYAVERGVLWFVNGSLSVLKQTLNLQDIDEKGFLYLPPNAVRGAEITQEALPEAWGGRDKVSLTSIREALSKKIKGQPLLPWITIQNAVSNARATNMLEIDTTESACNWPCNLEDLDKIIVKKIVNIIPKKINVVCHPKQENLLDFTEKLEDLSSWIANTGIPVTLEFKVSLSIQKDDNLSQESIEELKSLFESFNS